MSAARFYLNVLRGRRESVGVRVDLVVWLVGGRSGAFVQLGELWQFANYRAMLTQARDVHRGAQMTVARLYLEGLHCGRKSVAARGRSGCLAAVRGLSRLRTEAWG